MRLGIYNLFLAFCLSAAIFAPKCAMAEGDPVAQANTAAQNAGGGAAGEEARAQSLAKSADEASARGDQAQADLYRQMANNALSNAQSMRAAQAGNQAAAAARGDGGAGGGGSPTSSGGDGSSSPAMPFVIPPPPPPPPPSNNNNNPPPPPPPPPPAAQNNPPPSPPPSAPSDSGDSSAMADALSAMEGQGQDSSLDPNNGSPDSPGLTGNVTDQIANINKNALDQYQAYVSQFASQNGQGQNQNGNGGANGNGNGNGMNNGASGSSSGSTPGKPVTPTVAQQIQNVASGRNALASAAPSGYSSGGYSNGGTASNASMSDSGPPPLPNGTATSTGGRASLRAHISPQNKLLTSASASDSGSAPATTSASLGDFSSFGFNFGASAPAPAGELSSGGLSIGYAGNQTRAYFKSMAMPRDLKAVQQRIWVVSGSTRASHHRIAVPSNEIGLSFHRPSELTGDERIRIFKGTSAPPPPPALPEPPGVSATSSYHRR